MRDGIQKRASLVEAKEKDRLSALINSISDEIWFADTSKRFVLANPSALREFGLTSENQIDVEKFAWVSKYSARMAAPVL